MGSYLTIVNDTDDIFSVKVGPDAKALMVGTVVVGAVATAISCGAFAGVVAGTIVTVGTEISVGAAITTTTANVHQYFAGQGYETLHPGERKQYGKWSLSLWQQCHAVRVRKDGDYLITEEMYMRPIFTGPTDGSNNDHSIKWWLGKGCSEANRTMFKNN
jgi:hypothetical protein